MEFRIKEVLTERGISQKELSQMTGICESTISRYLAGETEKLAFHHVFAISKALNVNIVDLIKED